jgi:alcohol dehydrogenase
MAAREAEPQTMARRVAGRSIFARAVGATSCIDARDPGHPGDIDSRMAVSITPSRSRSPVSPEMAQKITVRGGTVCVGLGVFRRVLGPHVAWSRGAPRGSFMGGGVPQKEIPRYVDLFMRGRLPVDRLCSEQIDFEHINEGFDRLREGSVIRQILLPHGA